MGASSTVAAPPETSTAYSTGVYRAVISTAAVSMMKVVVKLAGSERMISTGSTDQPANTYPFSGGLAVTVTVVPATASVASAVPLLTTIS